MLLGTAQLSAQKKWTLQDCIDYAMENNITLKK
jgi:outer membrane protein